MGCAGVAWCITGLIIICAGPGDPYEPGGPVGVGIIPLVGGAGIIPF